MMNTPKPPTLDPTGELDSSVVSPEGVSDRPAPDERLSVLKTYKMYVGGSFPRTESGRFDKALGRDGRPLANICRGSRKDVRDAVTAARSAQRSWADRSAYNRAQILYRIAEMLEGRRAQFVHEIEQGPLTEIEDSGVAVDRAIDRLVYYAGWADKYPQLFSSVNPVASSHFNFSVPEPTGVVGIFAPEDPLLGLVSVIAPVIVGGNTCVVIASETAPLPAVSFAEVLNDSDVPGGVVNLITGRHEELLPPLASHMDVNAVLGTSSDPGLSETLQRESIHNLKRVVEWKSADWLEHEGPYQIESFQEIKTTWHPIGT